jgi:hypothetical protein
MKPILCNAIGLVVISYALAAEASIVTLTASSTNTAVEVTAELTIGQYEVAELVSFPSSLNGVDEGPRAYLDIIKDGKTFMHYVREPSYNPDRVRSPLEPVIIAGPATFRLKTNRSGLCTIKITPESFPPDRTILVPPGTNQVALTMECSTNLVSWFPATNGIYGPLPEAKFFRIKLTPSN